MKNIDKIIKKAINEVTWKQADNAAGMINDNVDFNGVFQAISVLRDNLEEYNAPLRKNAYGNSQYLGAYEIPQNRMKNENSKANQYLKLLDNMEKFFKLKQKQADNLLNLANDKFEKEHDGMNRKNYSDSLDNMDYNNMNDKQKEFVDYKW